MEIDFAVIEKMVELGASGADIFSMWKSHEEKRARMLSNESPRDRLFRDGLLKLINMTGRSAPSCRAFLGKCLKAAADDASVVLAALEDAETRKVADAPAWIAAKLKKRGAFDPVIPEEIDWDVILVTYKKTGRWSRWVGPDLDSPACRAPRDLLRKHGLRVAGEPDYVEKVAV